jgi:hypothetical protein
LVAIKLSEPEPLNPDPISTLLLVQLNSVAVPEKVVFTIAALQTERSFTAFIIGDGLIVIVNVCTGPLQFNPPPLNTGVTVIVAVIGAVPLLTAVNGAIDSVPEAPSPIDGVLFTHV